MSIILSEICPGGGQFRRAIGADRSWMDALDRGPWQISCTATRLSGSNPPPPMTNVEFQKTIRPRRTVTDA
jgi:hypothetical protein